MKEEKRIYVVVPKTIQVPVPPDGLWTGDLLKKLRTNNEVPTVTKPMVCGRAMAQVAHVTSAMREVCNIHGLDEITTIVLSCRNTKELCMLHKISTHMLMSFLFQDTNPEFYDTKEKIPTAFCTQPAEPSFVDEYLGHLPLWTCDGGC